MTPTPQPVALSASKACPNRLFVTIAVTGTVQQVIWTPSPQFAVEDAAGTPINGGILTLPPGSRSASFYVRKVSGTSLTVPVTLTGSFGTWRTFVGGGPDAW
jgi:hypothetical protein